MINIHPLLALDFYKTTHPEQFPQGLSKVVSYLTPRMSRLTKEDKLIVWKIQAFAKDFLVDYFNDHFFSQPLEELIEEYERVLDNTLGTGAYTSQKVRDLHNLGYLPLEIKAIPEGERIPMQVPMIEITNTHPDFAWLVNTIESIMSAELWHPMVCANVGYRYRQIVNKFYDISVDDDVPKNRALGDFSFRGQESFQSAMASSAAFCLSFLNTATVPTIPWLEQMYNCDCTKENVAFGSISTEHSVMCSNTAVDGNEKDFVERLLTQIYKNHSFSMVSDSYDYWNMVDNIIPSLKQEILNHQGTLLVRGDSGDPVKIVTQTVFSLWRTFGGTINSKGYKVLDPHVKAIYGDSITPERCTKIYEILIANGFACNNVALGVGSFSMQCAEETDENGITTLKPFTRDTYGIAVKSTYGELKDGTCFAIFKDPKTDTGNFKKSQKGRCIVYRKYNKDKTDYEIKYEDGFYEEPKVAMQHCDENILTTIFKDGNMVKEYTLDEVRQRLHGGKF